MPEGGCRTFTFALPAPHVVMPFGWVVISVLQFCAFSCWLLRYILWLFGFTHLRLTHVAPVTRVALLLHMPALRLRAFYPHLRDICVTTHFTFISCAGFVWWTRLLRTHTFAGLLHMGVAYRVYTVAFVNAGLRFNPTTLHAGLTRSCVYRVPFAAWIFLRPAHTLLVRRLLPTLLPHTDHARLTLVTLHHLLRCHIWLFGYIPVRSVYVTPGITLRRYRLILLVTDCDFTRARGYAHTRLPVPPHGPAHAVPRFTSLYGSLPRTHRAHGTPAHVCAHTHTDVIHSPVVLVGYAFAHLLLPHSTRGAVRLVTRFPFTLPHTFSPHQRLRAVRWFCRYTCPVLRLVMTYGCCAYDCGRRFAVTLPVPGSVGSRTEFWFCLPCWLPCRSYIWFPGFWFQVRAARCGSDCQHARAAHHTGLPVVLFTPSCITVQVTRCYLVT